MSLAIKNKTDISALLKYLSDALKKSDGKLTLKISGQQQGLEVSDAELATLIEQKKRKSWSVKEAAAILVIREINVRQIIAEGRLPAFEEDGKMRIDAEKLAVFKAKMDAEQEKNFAEYMKASQALNQPY